MQGFKIENCQVVWRKDRTQEGDRQAILNELRKMSTELQEAIDFTIKLNNKKPNEVKFWLETQMKPDFTLTIYYDEHATAWGMLIESLGTDSSSPQVVGEISCMDPLTFRFIEKEDILKTEPIL